MNAFVGATVLTPRTSISNGVVLTEGIRITHVGESTSMAVPQDAKVYEFPGRYIIPGLIDAHAHLAYMYEISGSRATVPPYSDIDNIEHGRFLTDENIDTMRTHGTALVTNLLWTLSPFTASQFPGAEEIARGSVKRPREAGIRIGIGADAYPIDHALARQRRL